MLLGSFLAAAAVLWAAIFGYTAVLLLLVRRHARPERGAPPQLPPIAVVMAVRNEATYIAAKLADLRRSDYPADRMTVVVVEGGSTDDTAALTVAAVDGGAAVELLRAPTARGKSEQLNVAFARVREDILVVTDADSSLEPSCLRRLVEMLAADPNTAIVGARIRPATRLLEERIHWWLLNRLWWLEGEAFGTAAVSGVCFAIRRSAIQPLPADCTAEDVHLALRASAAGKRVRICRTALATELRVPQTVAEFLRFRRRRGGGYVRELRRAAQISAPPAWRLARAVRLFHFLVVPGLTVAVAVMGLALLTTARWQWAVGAAVAFALPTLAVLGASRLLGGERRRWWRLGVAAGRLAGLTWLSLIAPTPSEPPPCPQRD